MSLSSLATATFDELASAPHAVFRVWRHRERIEIEAAQQFQKLAAGLAELWGDGDEVATLAREAEQDELMHARRCREILEFSSVPQPFEQATSYELGPVGMSLQNQVLYSCVAIGCVTETLSTALLIEMHKRALPGKIRETIHEILRDEINHSRIGWAELARASRVRSVGWLANYIPAMIAEAQVTDVAPMLSTASEDLSRWGILPSTHARNIMKQAVDQVIAPGFARYGIAVENI